MNTRHNTIISRIFLGLGICAIALFMCTSAGKGLLTKASSLFSPTTAQSAIMTENETGMLFQNALEAEIYLPQEVDLTAGSDFIPQLEQSSQAESRDITAMLNGAGHQCSFRNHMSGAVALNGESGCI